MPGRAVRARTVRPGRAALARIGGAENRRRLTGQRAAIAMHERELRTVDLTCAPLATQLAHGFDHDEYPIHAGVHAAQAAAIGVDRQFATRGDGAAGDIGAAFAFSAEAQVLE